jgi:hypothetical protein
MHLGRVGAEITADVRAGGLRGGQDGPDPAGHPALHPDEGIPAPLSYPGQPTRRLQLDPAVHADWVMDAGHQGQAEPFQPEHAVGQHLVVMDQVELGAAAAQFTQRAQAERQRLGKRAGLHGGELEHVDPVPVLRQPRRPERVLIGVQVQAGQLAQHRPGLQLGVGLTGEHLDVMAQRCQLAGQVTQVDALATAVRLAAVGQQRDAQRVLGGHHAGPTSRSPLAVRCW